MSLAVGGGTVDSNTITAAVGNGLSSLLGGDLLVAGLLIGPDVEVDEEEQVGCKQTASEESGVLLASAAAEGWEMRPVGRGEVRVGYVKIVAG